MFHARKCRVNCSPRLLPVQPSPPDFLGDDSQAASRAGAAGGRAGAAVCVARWHGAGAGLTRSNAAAGSRGAGLAGWLDGLRRNVAILSPQCLHCTAVIRRRRHWTLSCSRSKRRSNSGLKLSSRLLHTVSKITFPHRTVLRFHRNQHTPYLCRSFRRSAECLSGFAGNGQESRE